MSNYAGAMDGFIAIEMNTEIDVLYVLEYCTRALLEEDYFECWRGNIYQAEISHSKTRIVDVLTEERLKPGEMLESFLEQEMDTKEFTRLLLNWKDELVKKRRIRLSMGKGE